MLHLPQNEDLDIRPLVSILVPALNEEKTISEFIDWCWQGLKNADIPGEIIIIDSSEDDTGNLALAKGARVLRVPRKGLGQAYKDSIPYIRGEFVIMGDCDLTYDFRNIKPFLIELTNGNEFVMGNRFKGGIQPGAMPVLHQYFGTPVTTWFLNLIYQTKFRDIHCGMRGISLNALKKMDLKSRSWQYASEMIIKSTHMSLKTSEVGIQFFKDRDGRVSNLKRIGWWAPWHAAWISVELMLTWGINLIFEKIGYFLFFIFFSCLLMMLGGPIQIGQLKFSLHSMLIFGAICQVGYQFINIAILSKRLYGYYPMNLVERNLANFNKAIIISGVMFSLGLTLLLPIAFIFVKNNFELNQPMGYQSYLAVFGINLIILSISIITTSLLLNLINEKSLESN